MFGLGTGEIVIIGLVLVLMFGASKLPKLGSSMGQAIKNFKKGLNESSKEESEEEKKIDER